MAEAHGETAGRPGRPRATTHRAIREAALREFARNGYASTSVSRIAEVAGIGRNTFFSYFPTKVDVIGADYRENLAVLEARLDPRRPGTVANLVGDIVAAIRASLPYTEDDREVYRLRRDLTRVDPTVPFEWSEPILAPWMDVLSRYVMAVTGDTSAQAHAVAHAISAGAQGILGSVMDSWADERVDLATALQLLDETMDSTFSPVVALTWPQR